jgi:shikimate kinase
MASEITNFINIILIGMAGAGKSTVGPLLAEKLNFSFTDTDTLISTFYNAPLQYLLDTHGINGFRKMEEKILLRLNPHHTVVATGGSAIYSRLAMHHLKKIGSILWLDVPLPELEQRVNNQNCRGLINPEGSSFAELYSQRQPLYRHYATLQIDCSQQTPKDIVQHITNKQTQVSLTR